MNTFQLVAAVLRNPSVLSRKTPLLLLSHMRANTSLAGHIIGNSPQVSGYYEMHIGYYSWKSFVRQRLLYAEKHCLTPDTQYMFDKILHDEHKISPAVINSSNAKVLLSIRSPETTIPSILKLYERINPKHEFAHLDGAINYYSARLDQLAIYSKEIKNYFYYDAEDLRKNTEVCLSNISNYLSLTSKLSSEFKTQKLTGKAKAGDSSGNLNSGRVKKVTSNYATFDWDQKTLSSLTKKYHATKLLLKENSWNE